MLVKLKKFLFENSSIFQTVAKNTFWLFLGQIISRLLRAVVVVYGARKLGASSWGAFSYALGIATFLTSFSDIGINALITKEAAREPQSKDRYLATAFLIKLAFLIIIAALAPLIFLYFTKIEEAAAIMPILIFVFAFDTLRDLGSALSRALEKMQIEAFIQIFTNFLIAALGTVFLYFYGTAKALSFAYALGSGLGMAAIFFALKSHFKNMWKSFRFALVKPILMTAWPFGLLGLMGVIMLNTDIIMLGWLRTAEEVGYYAAAQKIIQLLYILPAIIAISIFPIMSRLIIANPLSVKRILEKAVSVSILIAAPIAAFGILFGDLIINLFFGPEYAQSILPFRILVATVLIVYPSSLIGHAIFVYDQQKSFAGFVAVAVSSNILLNLLLIPPFGINGAAAATILTQLMTNSLIWRKMKSVNQMEIWPWIKNFLRLRF
ncbi:MAG TPA: flippase [Candidatus Paceibacterota bacterium]